MTPSPRARPAGSTRASASRSATLTATRSVSERADSTAYPAVAPGAGRGVCQRGGRARADPFVADPAPAEAERGDLHVGATEPPPLHQSSRQALARQL